LGLGASFQPEFTMEDNGHTKSVYDKPKRPPQTAGQAVKSFIWNTETGAFCGRTGLSWAKITGFYIIFFSCLALFFLSMFWLFWQTLDADKPRWIGSASLIGSNPGVGFRPMPDQEKNAESTLIWLNEQKPERNEYWIDQLNLFFEKNYENNTADEELACAYGNKNKATPKSPCAVELVTEGCSKANGFGYNVSLTRAGQPKVHPCVLIKLNKIYGWTPDPYTQSQEDLDNAKKRGMPDELLERIKGLAPNDPQVNTIWISCVGESPADRESVGPIQYWAPGFKSQFPGIPGYYFPYEKQKGYKSPFVFVKFTKPSKNALIQLECKAWAKNIVADRQFRLGSVHFELMVD